MNAARRRLALAAQARLERVAAARRAFVRRPSPPAPWSAPRRRASSRCRCCCSAASRCWRPEVGAPRAHGPALGPHPGPALPWKLAAPDAPERALHAGGSSHGPQSCVESRPTTSPSQPDFWLGSNALLARGTCFKFFYLPNRSSSGSSRHFLCW